MFETFRTKYFMVWAFCGAAVPDRRTIGEERISGYDLSFWVSPKATVME
jgi:hypothetical protein